MICAALVVLIGGALAIWLGSSEHGVAARPRPRAVVLITLDTTRADRLGCYGFREGASSPTPALDAIAAEGIWYARAFAQVPLTLPSHASILTGLEPPQHGLRENEGHALVAPSARRFRTLAEDLAGEGWSTAAFVSGQTLDRRFGLDSGFDVYDDVGGASVGTAMLADRPADETTDRALAWLAEHDDRPFFLWVHYFDPHHPWVPHPELSELGLEPYELEIAFMDRAIARLVAALRARGDWDEALVIVVGDHGEGLGEHGEESHGHLVHDATIRVPLIVKPHASCTDALVDRLATTLDVAPTILACGFPATVAAGEVRGRDLFSPAAPHAYAESMYPYRQLGWSAPRAWREGEEKIIVSGGRIELFDLARDPDELADLAPARPERVRALAQGLRLHRAGLEPLFHDDPKSIGPSSLATTAYLGAAAPDLPSEPDDAVDAKLPRPADRMAFITLLDDLRHQLEHLGEGGSAEQASTFERVQALQRRIAAESEPENPAGAFWSGRALLLIGASSGEVALPPSYREAALEGAIDAFVRYRELRPRDPRGYDLSHLARLELHALGRETALDALIADADEQDRIGLLDGLGAALRAQARRLRGDLVGACRDLERAVELAPERATFRRDLEAVVRELEAAEDARPR